MDDDTRTPEERRKEQELLKRQLSRRGFLKASGALIVAGATGVTGQQQPHQPPQHVTPGPPLAPSTPVISQYPGEPHAEVPFAPEQPPQAGVLRFFTLREVRAVDAITARIMPGDEGDPGAREAGVVNFIDFMLSRSDGFAEPVYRDPPYAESYEGDEPPEASGYQIIWVPEDDFDRYGYQLALTPREMYRSGLVALDRYANEDMGSDFAELSEEEQDTILEAVANGEAFDDPPADEFFDMLRDHTIQGMFSDPIYGGNRNMAGWQLINYPGAQRAYTFSDMRSEGHDREPRSLAQLPHVHPGQPANEHVRLPVFGSGPEHRRDSR